MQIRFDDTAGAARLVSVEQVAGGPVAVQVNEDVPDEDRDRVVDGGR